MRSVYIYSLCFDLTPNKQRLKLCKANLVLVRPFIAVLLTPVSCLAISATVIASVVPILVQGQGIARYVHS